MICFEIWCSHVMAQKVQTHIKRNCFSIYIFFLTNYKSGITTAKRSNTYKQYIGKINITPNIYAKIHINNIHIKIRSQEQELLILEL
jgi:hypothetical protein